MYGWGMGGAALEVFYGAAARSMSMSWGNFLFGAFDPAGTVSVDKLPGALWPQAASLRVFGFHTWAIVLPQVVEGVLTVLVLYRAVRRLAGPLAGIVASAILALSPVTVALNRGNVADSLLILALVLAADATVAATRAGRLRALLAAGVWVGLAFQAKMTVAWLVGPALAATYLLAAPASARVRLGHVALAGALTAVVSLSWMTAVSLVPASERPYVDGTQNDSLFSQTFAYNGLSRLRRGSDVYSGAGHPAPFLVRLSQESGGPTHRSAPSWHRLLSGPFGRDDGWLLPAALVAALGVLWDRRGRSRRDPLRAAVVLWGLWLVVLGAFFSAGGYPNSYYVAALSPATGALCGMGVALAWRRRAEPATWGWLLGALVGSMAYGVYLLRGGTGVPGWLVPLACVAALAGALALGLRLRASARSGTGAGAGEAARPAAATALALALVVLLLAPGVASLLMVTRGLGPFAAPFEPASATVSRAQAAHLRALDGQVVEELDATYGTPMPMATDSSILAAPYILATGREILPIGGFQGGVPSPTLAQLRRDIATGQVRAMLVPSEGGEDPRMVWIRGHCAPPEAGSGRGGATALYDCTGD